MKHRGACACDNDSGDGAGVMSAIPHDFYVKEMLVLYLLFWEIIINLISVSVINFWQLN